ncbi:DUF6744 family protein [Actinoallomurus acanthiterrae]
MESFDAYAASVKADQTPLLGHVVLYSIFDRRIQHEELKRWFAELSLDPVFLPPLIRPDDAFEKVTGPTGIRVSYPLDPAADSDRHSPRRKAGEATLMVRHVRRDGHEIVRHLVREVRDEAKTTLSYDTRLADCIFRRAPNQVTTAAGAGVLEIKPVHAAIRALPDFERDNVYSLLEEIQDAYAQHCIYLTADKVRALIRAYVEHLNAIKLRPTGGVYFVPLAHEETLDKLRELTLRMGAGSCLWNIPLLDIDQMREMVVSAFTTKVKNDLEKLARDLAAAQDEHAPKATVQALARRFQALKASAAKHSELLSTSQDGTDAALQLVNIQLVSLLASTG